MVRHYRTDPVPSDLVQRIVRVVRRAPSAGFSQGHRVVVVTEPDLRQRIADLGESWYLERGYEPWLSQAPVHLILGIREASYHERYQEPDKLGPGR
jgi:nitroreductase